MDTLPSWLPAEFNEHVTQLIKSGGLNTAEPLLKRLVTHDDMKKVWTSLARKTVDAKKMIDFLEFVRLHPAMQGNTADPITIPSDKVQRKAFKKVSELSLQITKVLSDLSPTGDPQEGWDLAESALGCSELHAVTQTSKTKFLEIKRLQSNLDSLQQHIPVISFFETIAKVTEIASKMPDSALPKRRHSNRAKTNQLILDLRKYLKHHFSTESPALIAAIVNTAIFSSDGGITEDDVRKLKI